MLAFALFTATAPIALAGPVTYTMLRSDLTEVQVPAESLLTLRLDRPPVGGGPDKGFDRNGHHYHFDTTLTPDSTR
jgi:hypothetical protein